MRLAFPLLAAVAALLSSFTGQARAAAPSCQRDGAKLLAASGTLRVVSIAEKPGHTETRRDHVYGC
jgi:hypothetical protein